MEAPAWFINLDDIGKHEKKNEGGGDLKYAYPTSIKNVKPTLHILNDIKITIYIIINNTIYLKMVVVVDEV